MGGETQIIDIAKVIVEYWRERNSILVIEETGQIVIYKKGIHIPFPDTQIKNWINGYLNDPLENEAKDDEFLDVKFTTTLLHQVKNRLHSQISKLDEFDRFEWRVNCLNGYIDLRDGSFRPHIDFDKTPYLSLIQIPIEYDKEALCPMINKFLIDVFGVDRIAFIYEILAYLLYRSNKLHKAFIFFGEASSGKTTFIEMIREFLGEDNTQAVSLQNLDKPFQKSHLRGKLANIYDDLPIKKLTYIANFKEAVTNKTLRGQIKFIQELVKWPNFCKQIFTCNNLPEAPDKVGDEFWRRIILIHCTNFFDNGIKDFDIGDKITDPKELSGLLNCCIFHFKHLMARKHFVDRFDNIDTVKGIWQININPLKLFLDTNCSLIETEREETHFFRSQVNVFRKERNAMPISLNLIGRRLKDLGITQVKKGPKGNQKKYYKGIKINTVHLDGRINLDKILVGVDNPTLPKKVLDTLGEEIKF